MNNNKIYLKDYLSIAKELSYKKYDKRTSSNFPCRYRIEDVEESLKQYSKGMYYNIKTGKTHFKNECIAEYSYKTDIPEYSLDSMVDIENLINVQFLNIIFSSANRLHMGHKTV